MALAYDDIPGSWGIYSKDWPYLRFSSKDEVDRAFIACTKEHVVPYGSYVLVGNDIRCETEELKIALETWLNECPHKTYDALREHFIATRKWNR
jgi:hypothetical protein